MAPRSRANDKPILIVLSIPRVGGSFKSRNGD